MVAPDLTNVVERQDHRAVAALGLLLTTDEDLVAEVSGHECQTVIGYAELLAADITSDADRSWNRILLIADSVTVVRAVLPALTRMADTTKLVDVVVAGLPRPGLLTLPNGPVGSRTVTDARRYTVDKPVPYVRLTVRLKGSSRLGDVLGAMLEGGVSAAGRPAGGLRVGIASDVPEAMSWACGDPSAVRLDSDRPALVDNAPSPVDLVLAGSSARTDERHPAVLQVGGAERQPAWSDLIDAPREALERFVGRTGTDALVPPVDSDTLTPIGFLGDPDRDDVRLRRAGGVEPRRLVFAVGSRPVSAPFDEWSGLSERVVDQVRRHRAVHDDAWAHSGPVEQASFLVQAACAALPVVVTELSQTVRRLIGVPLAEALTSVTTSALSDRIRREWYCMRIRRLAFDAHGARRRWREMAGDVGMWAPPAMAVSVIVATKRPELLPRITRQVAEQDWPHPELVIGLHGFDRDHQRVREMAASYPGPLVIAEIPAERPFGDVLNELCARASGDVITKMDDDDWYSAHHVTDLVHAAEFSRADLVGSGAEFIYLEALDLTIRRHRANGNRYANRVPGAALLMSVDALRSVGGWRPVHRGVDTALARAVTDSGGSIYRSHGLGIVVYRAADGHTWDPGVEYFLRGDIDQWSGFAPPPGIIGDDPITKPLPPSWFDRVHRAGTHNGT